MLPDLDSLALFVRAAELRSLTKAAEASHIGLAAASRRMALLEHRFRTALFERSPRGVELTPAGESLLPHARAVLIEINEMQSDMRDHASGSRGVLDGHPRQATSSIHFRLHPARRVLNAFRFQPDAGSGRLWIEPRKRVSRPLDRGSFSLKTS